MAGGGSRLNVSTDGTSAAQFWLILSAPTPAVKGPAAEGLGG